MFRCARQGMNGSKELQPHAFACLRTGSAGLRLDILTGVDEKGLQL